MSDERALRVAERWFRALLLLYPADFREEMGESVVETYRDRARDALHRGGRANLWLFEVRALFDFLRNGIGERIRPVIGWRRSGNWGRDMETVARRLTRAPVFTVAVLGTLTIGLGAFATVFTVVQKVLLAPLPYERPEDLYWVWRDYSAIFDLDRGWLGGTDVAALDSAGGAIEAAVGLRRWTATLGGSGSEEPREISVMVSTDNLFRVLGSEPLIGRAFAPGESGEGRAGVVVLGYDLWRTHFGGDSAIIGRELRLDEELFTVIGVMGSGFNFVRHSSTGPAEDADAYLTFDYALAETDPGSGAFSGLIRAKHGASPQAVAAQVTSIGKHLDERDFSSRGVRWYAVAAKEDLIADVRPALAVLGIAGAFLVLVLTVNLATLLLSRAVQREREFAVSRALGANPMALARATLFEGGLLGLLGGAGGALAANWGIGLLTSLAPPNLPRLESIGLDAGIVAIILVTGASLGLAAGLLPATWATRSNLTTLLSKAAVRGGGAGGGWMRRGLVVVQVALSLILLSTGGLVVKSFERLLQAQPGFVPDGVLTLRIPMSLARFPEEIQAIVMHRRLQEAMRAVPGVTHVGATTSLPLTANADQTGIMFPGAPGNTGVEEHDAPLVDVIRVRPGLMPALSIPILQGTDFGPPREGGYREALIDRTLANDFYPNGGATGSLILSDEDTLIVAGVVEHARQYDLHRDGRGQLFIRNDDYPAATLNWAIRSTRDPEAIVPDVIAAVRRVDPALAVADIRPMNRIVDEALRQQRLSATLVGGFSLGALLLAAMGLFGVVSGAVTRRQHELAVRMALGAAHGRILQLVLREGAVLIGLGVLIAIPCMIFTGRAIRATLVGISPFDPATLLAVIAGLTIVTLAACYVPARRVTIIQPASALRQD